MSGGGVGEKGLLLRVRLPAARGRCGTVSGGGGGGGGGGEALAPPALLPPPPHDILSAVSRRLT